MRSRRPRCEARSGIGEECRQSGLEVCNGRIKRCTAPNGEGLWWGRERSAWRAVGDRYRRTSPVVGRPGKGLLTEPTPVARHRARELVFMPLSSHWPMPPGSGREGGQRTFGFTGFGSACHPTRTFSQRMVSLATVSSVRRSSLSAEPRITLRTHHRPFFRCAVRRLRQPKNRQGRERRGSPPEPGCRTG